MGGDVGGGKPENKAENTEFLFRSKLPDKISDHLPLHTYCFEQLAEFAERPCIINGVTGKVYSYAEVELISRKAAAGLPEVGLGQGEDVMLLL